MREINLFESLCLYRNLAACQLFSFNVLCVAHRQAGMLFVFFPLLVSVSCSQYFALDFEMKGDYIVYMMPNHCFIREQT